MKQKRGHLFALVGLLLLTGLFSCGEDRWAEYYPLTSRDLWIDSVMRVNYLWYDQITSSKKLNYFQEPATFLKSLIPSFDKYSHVDSLYTPIEPSFGFDYSLYRVSGSDSTYNALVTYVSPNSPASDAGLERGNWIMLIEGDSLTKNNQGLLDEGEGGELQIGKYVEVIDEENEIDTYIIEPIGQLTLPPTREVVEDAIHTTRILEISGTSHVVGYLAYNSFSSGTDEASETYNDRLRQFSKECQAAGVNDFVLDLRYNAGGEMTCVQLLADLLAPVNILDETFAQLEYNLLRSAENYSLTLDSQLMGSGVNLNLSTLYVITGSTTAGAAEMLINCLKPYMEVILIGQTTVGQTVATESFTNYEYAWVLSPVVCNVYNAVGEATDSGGFYPDYYISAFSYLQNYLSLGDPDEIMFKKALSLILGDTEEEVEKDTSDLKIEESHTGVKRSTLPGLRLK